MPRIDYHNPTDASPGDPVASPLERAALFGLVLAFISMICIIGFAAVSLLGPPAFRQGAELGFRLCGLFVLLTPPLVVGYAVYLLRHRPVGERVLVGTLLMFLQSIFVAFALLIGRILIGDPWPADQPDSIAPSVPTWSNFTATFLLTPCCCIVTP